jgi:sulfide-dependent adenosine diphosphate thiazole synthase
MDKTFAEVTEKDITKSIASLFNETIQEYADSDVIIIGAGPAGLTAGRKIASSGLKTLVVEQNNYLGGGYWVGGYMMNPVTVRSPA